MKIFAFLTSIFFWLYMLITWAAIGACGDGRLSLAVPGQGVYCIQAKRISEEQEPLPSR